MSDRIKKILALLSCAGNGLLGSIIVLGGLLSFDEDTLVLVLVGAAFLINALLMWMYARSLDQNIRYQEILAEEEKRRRLRKEIYEEEDLSGLLSGRSQYAEKETYRR